MRQIRRVSRELQRPALFVVSAQRQQAEVELARLREDVQQRLAVPAL